MWDLNDSLKDIEESEACSSQKTSIDGDDEKGKQVGSVSNSSSSAVVIENGSDEEIGASERRLLSHSGGSKIFGVCLYQEAMEESEPEPPVTRQFFPVDFQEQQATSSEAGAGGLAFPRANWVGVKFCQSEPIVEAGKSVIEAPQPLKKSRRGPRSRSSQYRGVTFYRRTGRWESHIWFALFVFLIIFCSYIGVQLIYILRSQVYTYIDLCLSEFNFFLASLSGILGNKFI